MTRSLVFAGMLATACATSSSELAAPRVLVRSGPAATRPIHRVVALPATCGSLQLERMDHLGGEPTFEVAECSPAALAGIDQAIRAAIDFAGLEVIDAERVNAVTATRQDVERRHALVASTTTETHGALFEDATPFEQAEILHELHADGVLNTRIWIGAGVGMSSRRTVAVQIRIVGATDHALAWARRCELEVGLVTDPVAIERAARCAAEGAVRK